MRPTTKLEIAIVATLSVLAYGQFVIELYRWKEAMNQDVFAHQKLIEQAEPSTVPTGQLWIYGKSDGYLYVKNDAGEVVNLSQNTGGGGGETPAAVSGDLLSFAADFSVVGEGGEIITDDLGDKFAQLEADTNHVIYTPWAKIPDPWRDAVIGGKFLNAEIGIGHRHESGGTAQLLITPQFHLSHTVSQASLSVENILQTGHGYFRSPVDYPDEPWTFEAGGIRTNTHGAIAVKQIDLPAHNVDEVTSCHLDLIFNTIDDSLDTFRVAIMPVANAAMPVGGSDAEYATYAAGESGWLGVDITIEPEDYTSPGFSASKSVDITALVQSVIELPSWSPGNSVIIAIYNTGEHPANATAYFAEGIAGSISYFNYFNFEPTAGPQGRRDTTIQPIELLLAPTNGQKRVLTIPTEYEPEVEGSIFHFSEWEWCRLKIARSPSVGTYEGDVQLFWSRLFLGDEASYGYGG